MNGWGKVLIGTTFYDHCPSLFVHCWTRLITQGMRDGDRLAWPNAFTYVHWARNIVVQMLLEQTDCDSLLFVDSDMTFEPGDLDRLRDNCDNWDYDIVSALATGKRWPPKPIVPRRVELDGPEVRAFGTHYEHFTDFEVGRIVPTDGCGMAFTLVRRRVFEAMLAEDGPKYTMWFEMPKRMGEDTYFCEKAIGLGFKCAVDTSVRIGHLGYNPVGWWTYELWQKVKQLEGVNG